MPVFNLVVSPANTSYSGKILALNPESYWRFGEASGTSFADSTGHGHTQTKQAGTLNYHADTSPISDGFFLGFSSTNGNPWLSAPNSAALDPTSQMTVMALVATLVSTGTPLIATYGDINALANQSWQFRFDNGKLELVTISGTTVDVLTQNSATANDGNAHLLAARVNGNAFDIWVDGVQVKSGTRATSAAPNSPGTVLSIAGASLGATIQADISEVAYWPTTALSDTQMASLAVYS